MRTRARAQGIHPRTRAALPAVGKDDLAVKIAREFGAQVRALRMHAGLRQADLAGAGLSRAGVAKLETGASLPSLDTLAHLAAVLGVRARDLLPDER